MQQLVSNYSAGVSSFEFDIDDKRVHLHCHWRLNGDISPTNGLCSPGYKENLPCSTLDLIFTPISIWSQEKTIVPQPHALNGRAPDDTAQLWPKDSQTGALQFLQDVIKKNTEDYGSCIVALKLLLPVVDGYVVRNDIIQRRFLTCQLAEKVVDFTTVGQHIQAFKYRGNQILKHSLGAAVGAIHLKRLPSVDIKLVECAMASLETDIKARLSFSWIVDRPLPRKRLALVDGKSYPTVSTASLGIYRAAKALGINLIVLDHNGHWAQDPVMGHMRDEFIVCDLTLDEDLPDRIVDALSKSKGPIHCITTFSDKYLPATARAAEKMALYTNPPEAMDICHDKRKTREFASANMRTLSVGGAMDLKEQLVRLTSPLQYPLIIKPAIGYSSEGVTKVASEAELLGAVQRNERKFPGIATLIEPYVSGPEVDANFILMDGELIWNEINDDFPSSAEISIIPPPQSTSRSFAELSTILPSILPEPEISLLKSSLTETLLKLGFKNGVFHLEARVKDSKMEYAMTDTGLELVPRQAEASEVSDPSVFLIEINPRVPGHQESFAVEYTYGIDYFALHMLAALSTCAPSSSTEDDIALKAVIRSLSQPLSTYVQYPTHVVFIPADRGGVFAGAKRLPEELMQYVVEHLVFMQNGEVCKDPDTEGKWPFVAFFVVAAILNGTEGRAQARTIGEIVRKSFEYIMD